MIKRLTYSILIAASLAAVTLIAQATGTPSVLRVKTDSNGYLKVASGTYASPDTTTTFSNTRLRTDSSGNLLITDGGSGGGFAPANATYITQTPSSLLSNEQAISALSSGILRGATTTGVITSLGDVLGLSNGGLGFSTATTGDIFYASGTNTPGKLADVATGSVLISGGVGAAPSYSSTLPSTVQGNITTLGAIGTVNGVTTAGFGVSTIVASTGNLSAQSANIAEVDLYASPPAGYYMVCAYRALTRAATSTSTTPNVIIRWVNDVNNYTSTFISSDSGNTIAGSFNQTCRPLRVSGGSAMRYSTTGYASSGATSMLYELWITVSRIA